MTQLNETIPGKVKTEDKPRIRAGTQPTLTLAGGKVKPPDAPKAQQNAVAQAAAALTGAMGATPPALNAGAPTTGLLPFELAEDQELLRFELALQSSVSGAVGSMDGLNIPSIQDLGAEALALLSDPEPVKASELLLNILQTKRRHGSAGDTNFRLWLFAQIKARGYTPELWDAGCIVVSTQPKSTVVFSCHVDTCHSLEESNGSTQKLAYDPNFSHLFLDPGAKSGCLGADDGVGIYILLRLLEKKVPGWYVFHTGEEMGGIGCRALTGNKLRRSWMEDRELVVAFDRAVKSGENPEVIVTQGGQACASVKFGEALCKALNSAGSFELPYVVSHKGSFTDSKVYAPYVPECVNIGCFYNRQHGPDEYLDVDGMERLVDAACKVAWDKLPIERTLTPSAAQDDGYGIPSNWQDRVNKQYGGQVKPQPNGYQKPAADVKGIPAGAKPVSPSKSVGYPLSIEDLSTSTYEDLVGFVEEYPEQASRMIMLLHSKIRGQRVEIETLHEMLEL